MKWFICVLTAFLFGCTDNAKYKEIEIGYRGPARTDPFLAANRMLAKLGHTTHASLRLAECIEHTGTLITPLQSFHTRGESDETLDWTKRGGHFVLLLAGGESWRDDWQEFDLSALWAALKKRDVPEQARLLKTLNIGEITHGKFESTDVKIGDENLKCNLTGSMKIESLPPYASVRAGENDKPSLLSYRFGAGRITLLAHAGPWRNRTIGSADHAALFAAIIALGDGDDVWFLNGVRISFWKMLWDRAWLALCALALLLIVWLARYLRRLGPIALFKTESTREFSDHLLLTGAFLWRHLEAGVLVRPVQNAVRTAARRQGWHELDDEFFKHITATTGIHAERARAALTSAGPTDSHSFRLIMQDLKKMLDAL